jgi:hypothetical protein
MSTSESRANLSQQLSEDAIRFILLLPLRKLDG